MIFQGFKRLIRDTGVHHSIGLEIKYIHLGYYSWNSSEWTNAQDL